MNLAHRLDAARGRPLPAVTPVPVPVPAAPVSAGPVGPPPTDALARLKDRVGKALFERMGSRLNDPSLSEQQLRSIVLAELDDVVDEEKVPLSPDERQRLTAELRSEERRVGKACRSRWSR